VRNNIFFGRRACGDLPFGRFGRPLPVNELQLVGTAPQKPFDEFAFVTLSLFIFYFEDFNIRSIVS
jgi:hypothetical protein